MRNECPTCGGDLAILGTLGGFTWFRCIHCGIECHSAIRHQEMKDDWRDWDEDEWDDEDRDRDAERDY